MRTFTKYPRLLGLSQISDRLVELEREVERNRVIGGVGVRVTRTETGTYVAADIPPPRRATEAGTDTWA